jgi:hypothetical protein
VTAEQLAERFDISISAARIRIEEIEQIRRRKKGLKRPLPLSVLNFLKDAEKKGLRITSLENKGPAKTHES